MYGRTQQRLQTTLQEITDAGLYKNERIIATPQDADIGVQQGDGEVTVTNFCANNYLGLANHPRLLAACHKALDTYGYGLSSVRFICGTQTVHKELEGALSTFLGTDDTILYSSCFDANAGLFETLLGPEDAIISDSLNHASIIDGVRLCKASRHRWKHGDMAELERHLQETADKRTRLIATDGVFSMDGDVANLQAICDLADRYDALVMVDDSHSTGFFGPTGRGTPEHCGVMGRVDIITSTLGKALGGASGGFTSGRKEIVDLLRQRSRPYLFSNSVPPPIAATALECVRMLSETTELRDQLEANTLRFRDEMSQAGFDITPGSHAIVPIMLGDARLASEMADALLAEGIYVIGFSYPVVPKGAARIRVQISAAHSAEMITHAVASFVKIGRSMGVIA
ncbi:MAG: glycine C-acetyltransferase [Myxococcales bacterium]|nr:glycine C-acetyltransferase [Myxococcales bacterium]